MTQKEKIAQNVREICYFKPELRFAQVVSICAAYGGWPSEDAFYCPDEVLLKGTHNMLDFMQPELTNSREDIVGAFEKTVDLAEEYRQNMVKNCHESEEYAAAWDDCIDYFVSTFGDVIGGRYEKQQP